MNKKDALLKVLLNNNEAKIYDIMDQLNIEEFEVTNLALEIESIFQENINIEIKGSYIYFEVIKPQNVYNVLRASSWKNFNDINFRLAYMMYRLIQYGEFINIDDFSDEMMVSRSTVNNDLKRVKSILYQYNSTITGVPNKGIHFEGSEFNARLILIYEVYDILSLTFVFDYNIRKLIKNIIDFYNLNDFRKSLFLKTFIISLVREKKNKLLTKQIPLYKNFEKNSSDINRLIEAIEKNYQFNFTESSIDFITFPINTRNSSFLNNVENQYNETQLKYIVHEMLEKIKSEFMIDINENEFFSKVKVHLLFLINRLIFKLPNQGVFSNQIKIRFPLAYELASISINVLKNEFDLKATEEDIGYFSIYYALVLNERKSLDRQEDNKLNNIAIITDRGVGLFELVSNQIKEIIGSEVSIEHIKTANLNQVDLRKYNILFTLEPLMSNENLPLIQIEPSLLSSGKTIANKIDEIMLEKEIDSLSILNKIDINFVTLEGDTSYYSNMKLIIHELQHRNIVSDNLLEQFERREQENSMLYNNKIAFPHLVDDKINRLLLIIGKNESTLSYDVDIIFFLVVPKHISNEDERILTELYNNLFSIIRSTKLVENITNVSDKEILRLLVRGGE